jgi:hypothetical protein
MCCIYQHVRHAIFVPHFPSKGSLQSMPMERALQHGRCCDMLGLK